MEGTREMNDLFIIFLAYSVLIIAGQLYIYYDMKKFIKNLYGNDGEKCTK